jgi:hypothetical protein
MPVAPSIGALGQFGICAAGGGAATTAFEFLEETLTSEREIIRTEGIRGTRLHPVERLRQGRQTPSGMVKLEPTYAELVTILPYIAAAASAQAGYNTYTPGDTVPVAFDAWIDRVAKVFVYNSCRTAKVTFKGGPGTPLSMAWEIEALSETVGNAGTFAALTISATPPFVFEDGVLTIGGATYQVIDFELVIDWVLKKDRFVNSLTRTDLPSTDLMITVKLVVPYTSDTVALYDGSVAGAAANINFTYLGAGGGAAGTNLKFDIAKIVFPAKKSPNVPNKDEITLLLEGEAKKSGSVAPLIISLDSTP